MFQTKVAQQIKIHILCSVFFFKSCRLWDNVEKYCRAGQVTMTIWRMRIACWITKATNTHWEYVTHCFIIATMVVWTPLNVTLYVQCLSCAKIEFRVHGRSCHLYLRKVILCLHKACKWMFEPRWGRISHTCPEKLQGSLILHNRYLVSGVKRAGRGVNHPPHVAPKLKKE